VVLKRTGLALKGTGVVLKRTGVTSAHITTPYNKQAVSSLDAQGLVSLESVHNQQQFLKSTTQSTSSLRIMLVTLQLFTNFPTNLLIY
jgi:hypothetical protein